MKHLSLTKLHQEELLALSESTLSLLKPKKEQLHELLHKPLTQLEEWSQKLYIHIKNPRKSLLTEEIQKLDQIRDQLAREILRTIAADLKSTQSTKQHAAKALDRVLRPFGKFYESALDVQSTAIRSITKDLEKNDEAKQAAATLGLSQLFQDMNEKNEQLDQKYIERTEHNAAHEKHPEAKDRLIEQYEALYQGMEQLQQLDSTANMQHLLTELKTLHQSYHAMIERRKKPKQEEHMPQEA